MHNIHLVIPLFKSIVEFTYGYVRVFVHSIQPSILVIGEEKRGHGRETWTVKCEHHQLLANQFLNLSSNATESGTMAIFQILVYSIY